ncbi:ABC transporter substrate-binding protein [Cytobacillus firmus]|uniref:ABC transporter substrate-binding protein n=1 Tax=Cytobacillus firmus TaxID=1399 RepID=A0AA46SGZ1_CYTFI|nr:ABC transporter substrate-binding protein [Cytobacillus firmus]UYG97671.1 ABC transporter substrate-binding protein [Cytobacillus firmus]
MKKFFAPLSVVFMLFLLILTGCGKEEEASTEASEKKKEEKTEDTRTVEHLYGKAEVPAEPKKIVLLSHVSWEGSLVSVGVKPYAVMAYDNEFPPHLTEELEGVKALPYADEINSEEILKLDPDLLIISDRYKPLYDQLSETIPTVVVEVGGDWKEDHLKVAEAAGKLDEGKKVIEDLEKEAEDIGSRVSEKMGDETFMAVAINKKDIRVYGRTNHATNSLLFDDLKLTPAENLPEDFGENISIEGLAKYNPDHILDVSYFNSGEFYDSVTQGEVWKSLKAVQNGNVHTLKTTWGYWDPIERQKGLKEIESLLLSE